VVLVASPDRRELIFGLGASGPARMLAARRWNRRRSIAGPVAREDNRRMAARLLLLLALIALLAVIAPAPSLAKEDPFAVLVCGADRCAELRGQAVDEASALLASPLFRRHGRARPFYDVLFAWRDSSGRPTTGSALRWVPAAGATRTDGSRGPVWSRTDATPTAVLSSATQGLRPRPARELDDPVEAVGAATAVARRKLLEASATGLPTAVPEPADDGMPAEPLAVLAGAAIIAIVSAVTFARRTRLRI
jgi:hypothetical protein